MIDLKAVQAEIFMRVFEILVHVLTLERRYMQLLEATAGEEM